MKSSPAWLLSHTRLEANRPNHDDLTTKAPIQSFASHARASSRVLKAGNSRREKRLKFSENAGGKFSVPTNADFLMYGLSKTAVCCMTRMGPRQKTLREIGKYQNRTEWMGSHKVGNCSENLTHIIRRTV
jgi:hypothetical protein